MADFATADALARVLDRCRAAGVPVTEVAGWRSRGHNPMASVSSVVLHHTVDNPPSDYPSLGVVTNGRPDLAGPLCNFGVGRQGTVYAVAAGAAWHAGATLQPWQSNSNSIGIECANNGTTEPWGEALLRSLRVLVQALQAEFGVPTARILGHKEVCSPPGRKIDPSFDCGAFRASLSAPAPAPAPAKGSGAYGGLGPAWPLPAGWYFGPRSGPTQSVSGYAGNGAGLRLWQQRMRDRGWSIAVTGLYDDQTRKVATAFQQQCGRAVDGRITIDTWWDAWNAKVTR